MPGERWVEECPAAAVDCLICDAADGTKPEALLEAPHRSFIEPEFLRDQVLPCLSEKGIYM